MPSFRSALSNGTVAERLAAWLGLALIAGAACIAYGVVIERRWYRRAGYRLAILPAGASPTTILHLSDLHYVARDRSKRRFLASLDQPDVTVLTGDILGEARAVESVVEALRPVRGRSASYFVLGSNDYFQPKPLSYAAYFQGRRRHRPGKVSRWRELVSMLERDGWVHLRNDRTDLRMDGVDYEVVGLDDPHIERHDLRIAPRRRPGAMGLAIVHSPDPAPELVAFGYDLILAGHTHGGQVRMPFVGALVTNSQVPTRLCMGLSRFGPTFLHVSPGLGTSKFAPFRFLCRPEATFLELVPPSDDRIGSSNGEARQRIAAGSEDTATSNARS
jgi:predicted MPP superfamily phosphohydrolase